jgi:hypothetical protein
MLIDPYATWALSGPRWWTPLGYDASRPIVGARAGPGMGCTVCTYIVEDLHPCRKCTMLKVPETGGRYQQYKLYQGD